MENFIRIDETDYSFFVNRANISGICINKNKPHEFEILMCGDETPTKFTFASVEERNNKLTEILRTEGYAISKDTEPQE